jgi:hypothetical protein
MPMLIYDILFFIFLMPFVVAGLYYSNNETFSCLNQTFPGMSVPFYSWLRLDSWIMLGFAISAIMNVFQLCICLATYCSYVMWLISKIIFILWRLAWLIVGSVLFWKHIHPGNPCDSPIRGYMWANLIIGFIHIIITIIFMILYKPDPLEMAPVMNMMPTPGPIPMTTTVRSGHFPGRGYAIGSSQVLY